MITVNRSFDRLDLAEPDERTFEAVAAGHALLANRIVGTDREGEAVTAIRSTGGAGLLEVGSPSRRRNRRREDPLFIRVVVDRRLRG